MLRSRTRRLIVALLIALVLLPLPLWAAKRRRAPTPTPTPSFYGPPSPVTAMLKRAAGSCMQFERDRFLTIAEVGETGRVFRIDPETILEVTPAVGIRLRLLYVEAPDGPIARRVMAGPKG